MYDEQRLHRRLPLRTAAQVHLGDGAVPVTTTTVNLSPGGLCLRFERDLPRGTPVTVSLALPSADRVQLAGLVRYSTAVVSEAEGPHQRGVYIVGVEFSSLADGERAELERVCAALAERRPG